MADYINREVALKILTRIANCVSGSSRRAVTRCVREIAPLAPANVEPVQHGERARTDDDWNSLSTFQCSACGEEWCFEIDEDLPTLNYNYRPNCDAKMDGGVGSEL